MSKRLPNREVINLQTLSGTSARIKKYDRHGKYLSNIGADGGAGSGVSGISNNFLASPTGVALDGSGNIYVADSYNNRITKFDSNGNYLAKFGNSGNGQFFNPGGIVLDGAGNICVADTNNNRIEKLDSNGNYLFSVGAGYNGVPGVPGDDSLINGQFNTPSGIAVDNSGNIYVADLSNNRIEKFDSRGHFLFGIGAGYNGVPGNIGDSTNGYDGQLTSPDTIELDASGNIYVGDEYSLQKFDSSGNYLTRYQVLSNNYYLDSNVFAIDSGGNIYTIGTGSGVSKYDNNGNLLLTFGTVGTSGGQPNGITADKIGNIYVLNGDAALIEKFDSNGNYLGQFGVYGNGNGQFNGASSITVDSSGNVYVADTGNSRIVKLIPAIATISGVITFDGIAPTAVAQNVTFTFRSNDGSPDIVKSLAIAANGVFTLTSQPSKPGVLHIKADKYLAVNTPMDSSGGHLTGQQATVEPGDANNDNSCDSSDFGLLIDSYGDVYNVNAPNADPYDIAADFNGDGSVDSSDFGLLIGNFNTVGAP